MYRNTRLAVLLAICLTGTAGAEGLRFDAPWIDHLVIIDTYNGCVADFNLDGRDDMAISSYGNTDVYYLQNNGLEQFELAAAIPVGAKHLDIQAGDINGDGWPDLSVVNDSDHSFCTLINDKSGSFSQARSYSGLFALDQLLFMSLDTDDALDLLVTAPEDCVVLLFRNSGNGVFEESVIFSIPGDVTGAVNGDLNRDGTDDLLLYSQDSKFIAVYWNDGAGGLIAGPVYEPNCGVSALGVFDRNGDGWPDILFNNLRFKTLEFWLNDQAGALVPHQVIDSGINLKLLFPGDFTGDGLDDLLGFPLAEASTIELCLFPGNADGGFEEHVAIPAGREAWKCFPLNMNGDDCLDIAGIRQGAGIPPPSVHAVTVHICTPGIPEPPAVYETGDEPGVMSAFNLDGDGSPDLATTNLRDGSVTLFLNDGTGRFSLHDTVHAGSTIIDAAFNDFNTNSLDDVVVLHPAQATFDLFVNTGPGGMVHMGYWSVPSSPVAIKSGDLNGDGVADLVVSHKQTPLISTYINPGDAHFIRGPDIPLDNYPNDLDLADITGDGLDDILVADYEYIHAFVFRGSGYTETWSAPSETSIQCVELNGDGLADLVRYAISENRLSAFISRGDGGFDGPAFTSEPWLKAMPGFGDLNGDGLDDYIAVNEQDGVSVRACINIGDFIFRGTGPYYGILGTASGFEFADFNGDGALDIAVAMKDYDRFQVLISRMDGVSLQGPATPVLPGATVKIDAVTSHLSGILADPVHLFVFLDDGCGNYYFWPSWRRQELDFREILLPGGLDVNEIVPAFTWPSGAGSGEIQFWGALLNSENNRILGVLDVLPVAYFE